IAEPLLALVQGFLSLLLERFESLAAADVSDRRDRSLPAGQSDRTEADLPREFGAVLAPAPQRQAASHHAAPWPAEEGAEVARMRAGEPAGDQDLERLATQLLGRISEDVHGAIAGELDQSALADDDHRIGTCRQDAAEFGFACFQLGFGI